MATVFKRVVPILRIFDVAKTREFYVDYLGFSVDFEHGSTITRPCSCRSRAAT
jgi:catechol 2,3-dioxygenase-like lactoylglutathione lyase family enzyme